MSLRPAAPATPNVPPDTVVITIGDEKVTAADFDKLIDAYPPQIRARIRSIGRRQFADYIVNLRVMAQEAKHRKLDESPDFKSRLALQAEQLLAQDLYQQLVASSKPDEAAMRKYYDEHKSDYLEVKARQILIRAKGSPIPAPKDHKELTDAEALAKAQEIRSKLVGGGDFDALAKAESDDTATASKGGDLGMVGHGRLMAPVEKVAFSIPVGDISEPVKSPLGYHIIKVEQREERTFEQVRPELERKLEGEKVRQEMEDLKTAAHVVLNPEFFGPAPAPHPVPAATEHPQAQPKPEQK